jgi:hypothetical protein
MSDCVSTKEADVRITGWLLVAIASTVLAAVTAAVPHWLESLFGLDLDGGNGVAEWVLVITPAAVAALAWLRVALRLRPAR